MSKSAGKRNHQGASPYEAKQAPTANAKPAAPGSAQMSSFQEGMRFFHARQFQQARELFTEATGGPDRAVSHRASLHVCMCDRRLQSSGVILNSAEEHYNYAITLMNARDLATAQIHLHAALDAEPAGDHVIYALAACQCLGGDLQQAYENLKRAIDLQPRNRLAARHDSDFAAMAEHQTFSRLLYPDRES